MKEVFEMIMSQLSKMSLNEQNAIIEQVVIETGKRRDAVIGKCEDESKELILANRDLAEKLRPKQ